MRLFIFIDHVMLTLGQKVLLHLGANCKLHLDDRERIMILILHTEQLTEYIMFTGLASSKLACILQQSTCLNRRLHLKSTALLHHNRKRTLKYEWSSGELKQSNFYNVTFGYIFEEDFR